MKNNFESKFIQNLIYSNYGLRVKAEQIEGELDDNFKLTCDGKSYFFKVYPANSEIEFVKFQSNLLNHLKKNKNFYAYLDVFKDEPLKSSSQFWKLPNVTITPHVAGVTAIEPSVKYMYSKYKKLKKNKNIKSDVNPSDGY